MKTLTVFTPSFNRANLLPRLYESLCQQTLFDFIWLVVDDGSTDRTRDLVALWIKEGLIEIEYCYKPNGGMHTAHNLAYSLMQTEINTCIDSDDWMPADAVECIVTNWAKFANDPTIAGLVGLDQYASGGLIGSLLPQDGTRTTLGKLYCKQQITGDKKLVYRNSVTKSMPRYPEYEGEKLVPLSWLYTLIDRNYKIVCINNFFVVVDYQNDGSSATIYKQYFTSPRGFRDSRSVNIKYGASFDFKLRNVVHYGISSFILKDFWYWASSPNKFLAIVTFPISLAGYIWLALKIKK